MVTKEKTEIEVSSNLISKTSLDTPMSFEEALAEASEFKLSEADYVVVTNIYEPLGKNKDELLGRPFFIRNVRFSADKVTGNPFVILHAIDQQNNRWLVTDGSSGIYTQMNALVTARIQNNHPTPYNFFLVANGLRKSEFGIDDKGNAVPLGDETAVSRGATYYLD